MPDRLPEINLLPDYRREGSAPSILFFIFVALIIIAFIVMGYFYFVTKSNLDRATSEANELTDKKDSLELEKATLETDDDSRYEQAVAFAENYAIPTSVLISEINHLLPDESYLREYNYRSSDVKLVTHFETLDIVANYTNKLMNLAFISDTKVDRIATFTLKEEESEDGELLFDVIPRYESEFTLTVNKQKLKEEAAENE